MDSKTHKESLPPTEEGIHFDAKADSNVQDEAEFSCHEEGQRTFPIACLRCGTIA